MKISVFQDEWYPVTSWWTRDDGTPELESEVREIDEAVMDRYTVTKASFKEAEEALAAAWEAAEPIPVHWDNEKHEWALDIETMSAQKPALDETVNHG